MGQALGEGKVSKIFINVSRVSWEVTSAWERRSGGGTSDLPGEEVSLDVLGEQQTIYGAIS